jgi:DNA helicase IV
VKSNSLTREDLMLRLRSSSQSGGPHGYRSQLFLEIYWPIHEHWNERLRQENAIDFEDMLCSAAEILESSSSDPGFDLILVDEFQDASQARARLVAGLVRRPGRHLLAVGDDWQAINRFAGADISVMTKFQTWFGEHQQLALTRTFRCPPAVSEVAAKFVGENPSQIPKSMASTRPASECLPRSDQVQLRAGDSNQCLADALREISARHPNEVVSVDVLARYNFQLNEARTALRAIPKNVRLEFRTVHRSKGLEADYIVVLGLETGHYGFPSTITDDPVLTLAMPYPEQFEHGEERRLLYVALTRARRQVILVVSPSTPSPFAVELSERHGLEMLSSDGQKVTHCPICAKGVLVERQGQYGKFLGCTNFPACRHTKNVA